MHTHTCAHTHARSLTHSLKRACTHTDTHTIREEDVLKKLTIFLPVTVLLGCCQWAHSTPQTVSSTPLAFALSPAGEVLPAALALHVCAWPLPWSWQVCEINANRLTCYHVQPKRVICMMTMTVPVSKLPVTWCTLGVISNAGFTQKSTKYTTCTNKGTNVTMEINKIHYMHN